MCLGDIVVYMNQRKDFYKIWCLISVFVVILFPLLIPTLSKVYFSYTLIIVTAQYNTELYYVIFLILLNLVLYYMEFSLYCVAFLLPLCTMDYFVGYF